MKRIIFLSTFIILVFLIIYSSMSSHSIASNILHGKEYYYNNDNLLNEDGTIMTTNSNNGAIVSKAKSIDTLKNSITVLVNKEYSLPSDYVPEDLVVPDILFNINYYDEKKLMRQEAATTIEQLFDASVEAGLNLYGISGYRSYDRQKQIYDTNIATKGEEYTNRYSARPGHSEHQTGLVMDVSTNSIGNQLEPVFAYTPEGKWLAQNAHLYGFIIRYPEGKESITGYSYEPWHIRYVGKDLAKYIYDNNLTLEEYYNYTPSNVQSNEISYDNVVDVDDSDTKKEIAPPSEEDIEKLEKKEPKEEEELEDSETVETTEIHTKKDIKKDSKKDTKNKDTKKKDSNKKDSPINDIPKEEATTPPSNTTTENSENAEVGKTPSNDSDVIGEDVTDTDPNTDIPPTTDTETPEDLLTSEETSSTPIN